jgi:molybdate transport repressor ModE-like protein
VAATVRGGRAGGGATLTPFGRELIRVYRKLDTEIQARAVRRFRPIASQARRAARASGARVPVVPLARR